MSKWGYNGLSEKDVRSMTHEKLIESVLRMFEVKEVNAEDRGSVLITDQLADSFRGLNNRRGIPMEEDKIVIKIYEKFFGTPYIFKEGYFYTKRKHLLLFSKYVKVGEYTYLIYAMGDHVRIDSSDAELLKIVKVICDDYHKITGEYDSVTYVLHKGESLK